MSKNFKKTVPLTITLMYGITLITVILAVSSAQATVLWDQPLSTINKRGYIDQQFDTAHSISNSYLADDFVNSVPWEISTIFIPGTGWNDFSSLRDADLLHFAIYADASGIPGSTIWHLPLDPRNAQIRITTDSDGDLSNVTLNLTTALNLEAGHWWLAFLPTMNRLWGQYGRQASDTTNGYTAQFINPPGGFGLGTGWQDWTVIANQDQTDLAFRIEGATGNRAVPEPGTMLLMGIGMAGAAISRWRTRKAHSIFKPKR
ncbi:MAG: PEP-CTERM sorting domain-containing protein [Clostridia bacterium]|nr:PEP-CTERM sorting domain-containing protein [Clostridia bacterium]